VANVSLDQVLEEKFTSPPGITQPPMYFIALCAAEETSLSGSNGQLWLFDDQEESVYQHYHGEIKRNMAAGGVIAGLEKEIDALKSQVRQSAPQRVSWWQRLFGKR